ncbi:unnamed protein product [Lepidochelys kempii]
MKAQAPSPARSFSSLRLVQGSRVCEAWLPAAWAALQERPWGSRWRGRGAAGSPPRGGAEPARPADDGSCAGRHGPITWVSPPRPSPNGTYGPLPPPPRGLRQWPCRAPQLGGSCSRPEPRRPVPSTPTPTRAGLPLQEAARPAARERERSEER